jgi:hypothetical protein
LLRELVALKTALNINVELASPGDFVPLPPGWRERSRLIGHEGNLTFYHVDFYAQALAKILRGHDKDTRDVQAMLDRGLIERQPLSELFDAIEPELFRYPAIDPSDFRRRVAEVAQGQ